MRVLMPVSYQAPSGGLLDHVRSLALRAPSFGNEVTVAGRDSEFLQGLAREGIETIVCNFEDPERALATVSENGFDWDLVHAHPFGSRKFGVLAAQKYGKPLVVTIHGWYDDQIDRWYETATTVIAVSPAISSRLRATAPGAGEKIITIPNGIKAAANAIDERAALTPPYTLTVASRIDADFDALGETLLDFVAEAQEHNDQRWRISIAGAGTHRESFIRRAAIVSTRRRGPEIEFLGWLDTPQLRRLYAGSFAAIAPGRSAVDAMASGVPTVMTRQIGSYSTLGATPVLEHFYGAPNKRLTGLDLYAQLSELATDGERWRSLSRGLRKATQLFYDDDIWQQVTNGVYEYAALSARRAR